MDNLSRVVVADDHQVIRMGIEATLDDMPFVERVGSVADSTQLITLLNARPCDILITDYAMPGGQYGDGLELIAFIRRHYPDLRIVVLTGIEKLALIRSLMVYGVNAILSKTDDMSHLRAAVQATRIGRRYHSPSIASTLRALPPAGNYPRLSQRESEVIALYVGGASISAIADKMKRSKQTISTQKVNAMRKLGIDNDADLFKYAIELGLTQKKPLGE
ncbi:MAG TPA: response regulator transcription factor [Dyella sp.]|uniref:response regulator transcription factor n=1 Tax=Dyella sp. TaxID=1869338 RepID=UPI002B569DB5|nr:response regulator transcription factor [Dyella sp.]HTV84036.1 response regulator transcription factor [Dyella sp.]